MLTSFSLDQLGWSACYSQQLTLEDLDAGLPARVSNVQRNLVTRAERTRLARRRGTAWPDRRCRHGDRGRRLAAHRARCTARDAHPRTSLADLAHGGRPRATHAGRRGELDTLFVVTSCNDDFNLSRLERYFTVARHAQVEPVIVLTKADLCADQESFATQAHSIARDVALLALNATARTAADALAPWLGRAQTVAFVGSSGVGKSTLVNMLLASDAQATAAIREHDAKGRHTTTSRQMFALPSGAWVIDTPGMRELKLGARGSSSQRGVRRYRNARAELSLPRLPASRRRRMRTARSRRRGAARRARLDQLSEAAARSERAAQSVRERRAIERRWGRMHRITSRRGPGTSRE